MNEKFVKRRSTSTHSTLPVRVIGNVELWMERARLVFPCLLQMTAIIINSPIYIDMNVKISKR